RQELLDGEPRDHGRGVREGSCRSGHRWSGFDAGVHPGRRSADHHRVTDVSVPGAGSAGSSTRPTTGLVSNSAVCRTDSLSAVTRGYIVHTFGCQMNEHDSERIAGLLEDDGYVQVPDQADADVVVLNTCCIRENADNKLYGTLGWLKPWKEASDGRQIVVAGCLAQKDRDLVRRKAPFVDVVLGTHNVHRAADLVGE